MKNSRIITSLVAFLTIALFIVIQGILSFIAIPSDTYTRHMFHEMYTSDNIDVLFIGASHTFRSFDPAVFEENSDKTYFNAGTSAQKIKDSYYVLKEVLRYHKPEQVIIETGFARFTGYIEGIHYSQIITDQMRFSPNKVQYFFDIYEMNDWIKSAFPIARYEYTALNSTNINIAYDMYNNGYLSYNEDFVSYPDEWYVEKGFVYREQGFEEGMVGELKNIGWDSENLDPESVKYLYKMIELCQEHDIEVIFVTAPIPYASMIQLGNYSESHDFIESIAQENGITYYDCNLLRLDVLKREDWDYFDEGHMNGEFAYEYSNVLKSMLDQHNNNEIEIEEYLYNDFDELYRNIDFVTNTWFDVIESDDEITLKAKSVYGYEIIPEYRFEIKENDESDFILLQDYSTNDTLILDKSSSGSTVKLLTRQIGSNDEYEQIYLLKLNDILE